MDVGDWLRSLGLGQYEQAFRDNEIDEQILPSLTGEDLKEIGVGPVGHRRKLLEAIAALSAGKPSPSPPTIGSGCGVRYSQQRRAAPADDHVLRSGRLDGACGAARPRGFAGGARGLPPRRRRRGRGGRAALSPSIWATACSFISVIRRRTSTTPSRQCAPAWRWSTGSAGWRAVPARLASRVGIATGLVVVGDLIGSGDAQERGVVGETPNLAARLQEMGGPGAVLIADSTRRLVGDLFEYRNLGLVEIKGLAEPVPVWQVLRESTVENRFEALRSAVAEPAGRPRRGTRVAAAPLGTRQGGRRADRADLRRGRHRQVAHDGGVAGEAGGGAAYPAALFLLAAPSRQRALPVRCAARARRRFQPRGCPAAKLDKLAALLSRSGDTPPETVAVFADLLGLPTEERYPPPPTDPRQRRELILGALVRQLERLARRQPVLFVFEDAHWADSTSLELLERVAERVRRLPVLLVLTHRPDFEPPWTGESQVTSLTLSRLGRRESAALTERVAGGKALPTEILDRDRRAHRRHPAVYRGADENAVGGRPAQRGGWALYPRRCRAVAGDPFEPAGFADGAARPPGAGQRGGANRRSDRPRIFLCGPGSGCPPSA